MQSILNILPLAFVMIAGPQIISAVFLATSDRWRANSACFLLGATVSITLIVTIAFLVVDATGAKSGDSSGGGRSWLDWLIGALLVLAAVHVYRTRHTAEPPKWMGRLQAATPGFSLKLGFLLLGVFPSDLLTSVTIGAHLAGHNLPWSNSLAFVGLTVLLLALPAILLLLFGHRAEVFLPKARGWMNANSWIISEIVFIFFIFITLG